AVAFSRDGKYLATASWDNTARVWSASTGEEIAKVNHDADVIAVAFSRDGKYLATASSDNTARVHFLKREDMLKEACRRLPRNLTAYEWKRYMDKELRQYEKTCEDLPVHRSLLAEARKLAQENKVEEAKHLLSALLKFDDKIDLLPKTEAIEQNPRTAASQFQAEGKVSEGVKQANDGKVEEVVRLFEEAQKLEPDIDLNLNTEEIENDPEAVARQLVAENKLSEGVRKAEDGKIEEAIRLFQEAQKLEPDIDLNPNQKGEQIKPEKVARRLAAKSKLREGVRKAEDGKVSEAIDLFQQAQKLEPDIDLNPNQKGEQIKPEKVARRLAAKSKVREGVRKAEYGEIEKAISLFQDAQELQPNIDLNPNQKGEQIKPEKVARRLAAKSKVQKGVLLAAEGKVSEAIALFQKAQTLQPDIDLFPYTEEIENDPEAVARLLSAP
ncbi:MAG: hypothetical protein SXA11_20505, partial [Cyanobacteriota bacterium]|nr:hypothetical protein [Cyanobacteriota bacterium]